MKSQLPTSATSAERHDHVEHPAPVVGLGERSRRPPARPSGRAPSPCRRSRSPRRGARADRSPSTIACDAGTSGAPTAPCSARKTHQLSSESARPQAERGRAEGDHAGEAHRRRAEARHEPARERRRDRGGDEVGGDTQAIWSCVAESAPCICGSDTFAMVTVIAYRKVTAVQVPSTSARCGSGVHGLVYCKLGN